MTSTLNQKNDILEQIFTQLKKHFSEKEQKTLQLFINSVYRDVSVADLTQISQEDLNGLTVSLWREALLRKGDDAKIKVFNPDVEQDEWQSAHTVISVICRNIPFVIDTLKLVINELNIKLHRVFYCELCSERGKSGKLTSLNATSADELLLYFEIDQTTSNSEREKIQTSIENALFDVALVVDDFSALTRKVKQELKYSKGDKSSENFNDIAEQQTFLTWLLDDHFTFIGCDQFSVEKGKISSVKNSQLGLLKRDDFLREPLPFELVDTLKKQSLIHFSKASQRAMVHRPAYPDVIYIKRFNEQGELVSGHRFIGLYTSSVYSGSPKLIPIVRRKINNVLAQSGYSQGSHYFKELSQILYTFPVEDLLLCNEATLLSNVIEVLHVQERKDLKLFMRCAGNKQFVIATLYVPRDIYSTKVRLTFEELICRTLEVEDIDFQTYLSESNLARLRVVLRLKSPLDQVLEEQAIQERMKQLTRRWDEELHVALIDQFGEEKGVQLTKKYIEAFPSSYQDSFSSRVAVADIERIESLYGDDNRSMALRFYRSIEPNSSELKLKLFHQDGALLLSDLIPILENMGLKVAEEYPYKVVPTGEKYFWLYDFTLIYSQAKNFDPDAHRDRFADAFLSVWYAKTDNDAFNKLILGASLTCRDIVMLRAYAKYLKQLRFGFSHLSIAKTLLSHSKLVKEIVALFNLRFNPENSCDLEKQNKLRNKILTALNDVTNLNEDRVLRKYVELIMATVRCNYFQTEQGQPHDYVSFKFDHNLISEIPLPRLNYEIFVYSPRVEGVHLRGGKVARGGLRWSDRGEDFRTEVLGLVKAQQVKNSVIVPVGAKGGFVAKKLTQKMDRETFMAEGISCYKIFITALLSITDNLDADKVIPPRDVICYDNEDPYLVVAADKGTATFSDIANELATDRHFWLNDAFASGGSNGYDHKKMGITARGAWISVQRHFRELGTDVQTKPISVIGIGDMAGDVFGNGMLSSKCISLLAAFNHLHIFVDPTPLDLEASFNERLRLFETPRTGWADYDKKLISKGGGIFERSAKSIDVTPEMAKRFDIYQKQVTPTELITILLKAQVDLLWNGGIGTYVKGTEETHADVGDKANDVLRVNGNDLRCAVVGEGGNLGFTQRARIEYALNGGLCFTDAIDNAAGVNCSDLEVNIKILLDKLVEKGDLTVKQRNVWLVNMTDEVAQIVLANNYRQAQSISLSYLEGFKRIEEFRRLIIDLEEKGKLNRALEFIPNDDVLNEYKSTQRGLTRPSIAVMLSYAKNELKEALANEKVADDPYLLKEAEKIFPASLVKKYQKEVHQHPLVTEIVATQVSNDLFNSMGPTFAQRIMASAGCSFLDVCKAWVAARDIFAMAETLLEIEALDNKVSTKVQGVLIERLKRMVRHATRWLVRNHRADLDTGALVKRYKQPLKELVSQLDTLLIGSSILHRQSVIECFVEDNVPRDLAASLSSSDQIYAMLGVISVAKNVSISPEQALKVYFHSGESLKLFDISKQLNLLPGDSHWQSLAREAMRDDLEWQQLRISKGILEKVKDGVDISDAFVEWHTSHHILSERWQRMAEAMLAVSKPEFSMCQVALRELLDLSQN
ncbi:NAD-glutamate dehydrogenase [Psychromonas sp. psych-6C06]|uniref:NAD-glutamate dehydrogenase n=1 Tax=Psychromonas sp. psych-6C06 TaxID=2058089 RepID=UPI000C31E868|nr:NAD-glutamate dehydrogenase [Psychromonas sp. psych-6C06]PKF60446.1 NAD-glutamate dehydrogenase [Psychromonas sp. psych-6C06]